MPAKYKVPQLALRMVKEKTVTINRPRLEGPMDAAIVARGMIGDRPTEHLIAILLDGTNTVAGVTVLSHGGMHTTSVCVSDVLRAVLATHAAAFVLSHNHPSGDPTPSSADRALTDKIADAAKLIGITLLDHVIVTRTEAYASVLG